MVALATSYTDRPAGPTIILSCSWRTYLTNSRNVCCVIWVGTSGFMRFGYCIIVLIGSSDPCFVDHELTIQRGSCV